MTIQQSQSVKVWAWIEASARRSRSVRAQVGTITETAGVALWLPPGAAPAEELLVSVIRETVSGERRDAMFSIFEQMDAYHPREAHWHLPLIGVHPDSQGRGVGSALLRQVLDRCDRDSVPAYLEATSPRNVALYQRNGFEKLGGIEVADCPPIVPMLRKPR